MKDLQKNVQAIRMPEDMQQRLLSGFPPEKRRFSPALIAAVLALCLLLPTGAYAAGKAGFFKDVKRKRYGGDFRHSRFAGFLDSCDCYHSEPR